MDEMKDMLKALVNGQHALRKELLEEITKLDAKLERFRQETKTEFAEVHKRLDKQGAQLAFLEDDAPTREEHSTLERRVENIEQHLKN